MASYYNRDIHLKTCGYAKYRFTPPSTPLIPSLEDSSFPSKVTTDQSSSAVTGTSSSSENEIISNDLISVRIATPISSST